MECGGSFRSDHKVEQPAYLWSDSRDITQHATGREKLERRLLELAELLEHDFGGSHVGNHFVDRIDPAARRRHSNLAAQQELGLLPKRRPGIGVDHYHRVAFDGTFVNRCRSGATDYPKAGNPLGIFFGRKQCLVSLIR